jgi:hypothetical protein
VASFVQQKRSIVSTQPRNPKRDKNHFFGGDAIHKIESKDFIVCFVSSAV